MKATAKRRRTKEQIRLDKLAEDQKKADIEKKLSELEDMKVQMAHMQQMLLQNQADQDKIDQVQNMINQGWLKDGGDGRVVPVTDGDESEMIRLSAFDDAESQ